jgi:uncharacterized protein (DUF111 family)
MRFGISGDMFSAACYSFMDSASKELFRRRAERGCESLGGRYEIVSKDEGSILGHAVRATMQSSGTVTTAAEARNRLRSVVESLGVSEPGISFAESVLGTVLAAEATAHGVSVEEVHLHEVGRPEGLLNMSSAGLCYELLGLSECDVIGSVISVGRGMVPTEHGAVRVPAPACAAIIGSMKTNPGPYEGEMATPTGLAIAKNLIGRQTNELPENRRVGIGFGGRRFLEGIGFLRLIDGGDGV